MSSSKSEAERQFNKDKEEYIKNLLQAALVYALKTQGFDEKKYYVEDVTAVLADYQTLILQMIDELIVGSFAVMRQFGDKYKHPP